MKYIFLTASFLFGIAGISQAMDAFLNEGGSHVAKLPVVFNLQFIEISFQPTPLFARILFLSVGFFSLFLIWQKLKKLGLGKIWEYTPY